MMNSARSLAILLMTALCLGVPCRQGDAAPRRRRVVHPYVHLAAPWPSVMPPKISLSTAANYYRSAEARLAQFITNLQMGRRARAAALLSSRVGAADRQALIEKRWLRKNFADRKDFTQLLFLPDLQIRTRDFRKESVVCYIIPRGAAPKKSRLPAGYLPVPMRRENGKWTVDLRPRRLVTVWQ